MTGSTIVFAEAANSVCKSFPSLGTQDPEVAVEAGEWRPGADEVVSNGFLNPGCSAASCNLSTCRPIPRQAVCLDQWKKLDDDKTPRVYTTALKVTLQKLDGQEPGIEATWQATLPRADFSTNGSEANKAPEPNFHEKRIKDLEEKRRKAEITAESEKLPVDTEISREEILARYEKDLNSNASSLQRAYDICLADTLDNSTVLKIDRRPEMPWLDNSKS